VLEETRIGDSIAVNGVCLSVTALRDDAATFHVSPTTSSQTNFRAGVLRVGQMVNLERALRLSDRLGGHLVSGHVDGLARLITVEREREDAVFEFQYPSALRPLVVRKGSVTLDGISLTIAETLSSSFRVAVIPQTLADTNLGERRAGDSLHIEADMFARYVQHMLSLNSMGGR
jgi:riboflavin synthase